MAHEVVKAGYWFSAYGRPVAQINSALFTHLYAGFALVNRVPLRDNEHKVITFPLHHEKIFQDFPNTVRSRNPAVKALLSIGGEGHNISEAIAYAVSDPQRRTRFINESIQLARDFQYDGLDLCWLYPSHSDHQAQLRDLLIEWRSALDEDVQKTNRPMLLLTAAVFHHPIIPARTVDNNAAEFRYPITALANLDRINILAIDFFTPSNSPDKTGPVHGWKIGSANGLDGIESWTKNGEIPTNKFLLGLPFYGYQWTLKNSRNHGFYAPANPANTQSLEFRNIQANFIQANPNGILVDDNPNVAPYWYSDATWIGFENANSISTKIESAVTKKNLGGYFAWHVTADDDRNTLSSAASNAWGDHP